VVEKKVVRGCYGGERKWLWWWKVREKVSYVREEKREKKEIFCDFLWNFFW
jgi:hypothetical protein